MAERQRREAQDLFEVPVADDLFVQAGRIAEALLFAATEPLDEAKIAAKLPKECDVVRVLEELSAQYAHRGVQLRRVAGKWMLRTADDLAPVLRDEAVEVKKLSRAQMETLAIIAYHQPVTRAEIEEVRGVATSKGVLDVLLETAWIRMRGRRRTPGRPVTYGTTERFLIHFGLDSVRDLPGLDELKGTGLVDGRLPAGFAIPLPSDDPELTPDEDPLDEGELGDELADELELLAEGEEERGENSVQEAGVSEGTAELRAHEDEASSKEEPRKG